MQLLLPLAVASSTLFAKKQSRIFSGMARWAVVHEGKTPHFFRVGGDYCYKIWIKRETGSQMRKDKEVKEETCVYWSDAYRTYLSSDSTARQRVYIQERKTMCILLWGINLTRDATGTREFRSRSSLSIPNFHRIPLWSMPAIPLNLHHFFGCFFV